MLGAPAGSLRACGLSERKAAYILDLAGRFASGALSTTRIATMDDDAMFAELSAIKGIGAPPLACTHETGVKPACAHLVLQSVCKQQQVCATYIVCRAVSCWNVAVKNLVVKPGIPGGAALLRGRNS